MPGRIYNRTRSTSPNGPPLHSQVGRMGRALATMDLVGEAIPALGTCNRPTEAATAIAEVDA